MRTYENQMGVEKAFMKSYDGYEAIGETGVLFHNVDFKFMNDRWDGGSLFLDYGTGRYEITSYGSVVKVGSFELKINLFG